MEIKIKLESIHFTDEQNQLAYDEMITIDWPFPFLPRKDEFFECDNVLDNLMPDWYEEDLAWSVDYVRYDKKAGKIFVELWLLGE